ncbi:MAG: type II secretion system GspH family protein [Planctomycetes bacterium]|nr:type II secretion system GspH family protein [Planctomycetota bacterium]
MVVAILGIIIALVLVGVGRATQAGRATACRGNLRTIGTAANTYSSSNKGRLPSPRTDTPAGWSSLKNDPNDPTSAIREDAANTYIGWVRTEVPAVPGSIKANGFNQYETPIALQKGSLYEYIGSEAAYKSPQDPTARVRSYSLNSFVGVQYCDDFYPLGNSGNISKNYSYDTRTVSRIPHPAETLLALPEWDQAKGQTGWNANGFLGNPEITLDTATGTFSNGKWYDAPSVWNPGEVNMVHVDGSVEGYQIQSPEMKNGDLQAQYKSSPGYPDLPDTFVDLYNIKKMLLPGKIK